MMNLFVVFMVLFEDGADAMKAVALTCIYAARVSLLTSLHLSAIHAWVVTNVGQASIGFLHERWAERDHDAVNYYYRMLIAITHVYNIPAYVLTTVLRTL